MYEKLIFFDFDYTLARTRECVWIFSPRGTREKNGKSYRLVDSIQYNFINLGNDEYLDDVAFHEFDKVDPDTPAIQIGIMILNQFLEDCNNKVFIITARKQIVEQDVLSFLLKNNVKNAKNITFYGLDSSKPKDKFNKVKEEIELKKPDEVYVFDDNKKVINFFNKNKNSLNTKVNSCFVEDKNSKTMITFHY